jgi:hypothetical protein
MRDRFVASDPVPEATIEVETSMTVALGAD